MKCPICNGNGGVLLFSSISPCDTCYGVKPSAVKSSDDRVIRHVGIGTWSRDGSQWSIDAVLWLEIGERGWWDEGEGDTGMIPVLRNIGRTGGFPGWEATSERGTKVKCLPRTTDPDEPDILYRLTRIP